MRLVLGALAYLLGVGAVVAASFAAYQVMLPTERNAATTAASSAPVATASTAAAVTTGSSVPAPRAEPKRVEPKRVEPIRPVDEPVQTPTPTYELSSSTSVPVTSTAAYNKKKAQEQSAHRSTTPRKHRAPKISREAANAYGSNSYGSNSYGSNSYGWGQQNYAPPPPRRPRDWSIY